MKSEKSSACSIFYLIFQINLLFSWVSKPFNWAKALHGIYKIISDFWNAFNLKRKMFFTCSYRAKKTRKIVGLNDMCCEFQCSWLSYSSSTWWKYFSIQTLPLFFPVIFVYVSSIYRLNLDEFSVYRLSHLLSWSSSSLILTELSSRKGAKHFMSYTEWTFLVI